MFKVLLEHASFNESLSTHKQYKFALFILCQLPKLIHTDAKIGSGLFNSQICFFPDRDFILQGQCPPFFVITQKLRRIVRRSDFYSASWIFCSFPSDLGSLYSARISGGIAVSVCCKDAMVRCNSSCSWTFLSSSSNRCTLGLLAFASFFSTAISPSRFPVPAK